MGDVVVLGGYWILMSSDVVIVDVGIIIGSIGVFGILLMVEGLMDKLFLYIGGVMMIWLVGGYDLCCLLDLCMKVVV